MTDEQTGPEEGTTGATDQEAGGPEERRTARERVSDGFQRGLGVLSAFKEALEETISEARERGDLSAERAKEVLKGAMGRAREATSDARERFDFVTQQEFDELVARVSDLERKVRERFGGDDAPGSAGDGPESGPGA